MKIKYKYSPLNKKYFKNNKMKNTKKYCIYCGYNIFYAFI